nr:MAG: isoprenylcysteine carboxylmethyltransferase family protein [Leptolyngbya sp. IPPAS B-1204]
MHKGTKITAFIYGVICYVIFFVTFLYAIGFVGNFVVPKSIDSAPIIPLERAFLVNIGLLGFFGLQHSAMARQEFKTWWTKIVPKPVERSTYVLFSSLCLITLFYFWQPLGVTIWHVANPIFRSLLYACFGFGWLLVLVSTFLINHFDLFGLRQVYLYLRGKNYMPLNFVTPGLYRYVRHPLYVGWFFAFWSTPTMTVTHLVFAVVTMMYILIAIRLEERDLVKVYGIAYINYRNRVPMLIPFSRRRD